MEKNNQKPKLPVHLILGASDYVWVKTSEKLRVGNVGEPLLRRLRLNGLC